ncbi:hypothetical protein SHIRM173S_12684 [Streptomyces hirsutus]
MVAAVMSAVASATGAALAVRDDAAYRRRLYRLADRRRRSTPPVPATPGTVFLQLDGVGHDVLLHAVDQGLMPTVARWLGTHDAVLPHSHRLTPGAPTGPARPAPARRASCTATTTTSPPSAGTRRTAGR